MQAESTDPCSKCVYFCDSSCFPTAPFWDIFQIGIAMMASRLLLLVSIYHFPSPPTPIYLIMSFSFTLSHFFPIPPHSYVVRFFLIFPHTLYVWCCYSGLFRRLIKLFLALNLCPFFSRKTHFAFPHHDLLPWLPSFYLFIYLFLVVSFTPPHNTLTHTRSIQML